MTKTTTTLVSEQVSLTIPASEIVLESERRVTKGEKQIVQAFAHWGKVGQTADEATVLLAWHLIVNDSVSSRRASELAVEVLGTARGWTKDRVTAVRWTQPVWARLATALDQNEDDIVLDESGDPVAVVDLIARVSTLANRLGKSRTENAIGTVDVASVSAYVTALEDALVAVELRAENTPPADEVEVEVEDESKKSNWTLDHALATAVAKARKEGITDEAIYASLALVVATLNIESV